MRGGSLSRDRAPGGLAAAFVALQRPDLIANVLSQSGAFWRSAEASNDAPFEWLTAQVKASPKKPVKFYVEVGAEENGHQGAESRVPEPGSSKMCSWR